MKIPAKENIPSRRTIKERFDNRLKGVSKLFNPISELLAEEAERIINETWLMPEPEPEEQKYMTLVQKSRRPSQRHYCNNCHRLNIYIGHSFCPNCGIPIVWANTK